MMLTTLSCLSVVVLLTAIHAVSGVEQPFQLSSQHEVTSLPGLQDGLRSRHFTGYLTVGAQAADHLFYWLVESEGEPAKDPVVLWLTGGPGCSSMDALIYEHGPFTFTPSDPDDIPASDIELRENRWSWSKAATMVYVDSPVGAGLSFSSDEREYATDDEQTTDHLLEFLVALLGREFPHLRARDLYIAGESYAGVYVPLLARKVMDHNARTGTPSSEVLHLRGYAVGNGVADDAADGNGQPEFAYGMGLMDPPTHARLQEVCAGNYWNATPGSACASELRQAYDTFYWVNPYDILEDCHTYAQPRAAGGEQGAQAAGAQAGSRALRAQGRSAHVSMRAPSRAGGATATPSTTQTAVQQQASAGNAGEGSSSTARSIVRTALAQLPHPLQWPLGGVLPPVGQPVRSWHGLVGHVVPCADRRVALAWMNREEVRAALHVPPASQLNWQPCSDKLHYRTGPVSMTALHAQLVERGLRALVYSGDHDFVVPFTSTRDWVYRLGLRQEQPYKPWTVDGQVAGFTARFSPGLVFATVKGAGHMVPQTSPERGLHLITRFLYDTL